MGPPFPSNIGLIKHLQKLKLPLAGQRVPVMVAVALDAAGAALLVERLVAAL